jgi:hypothetical protein
MTNEIANMQISDEQETARLNAELARMEGGCAGFWSSRTRHDKSDKILWVGGPASI